MAGKWWYWDEGYTENGPFDSEHEARIDLELYCWFCLDNNRIFGVPAKKYMTWQYEKLFADLERNRA